MKFSPKWFLGGVFPVVLFLNVPDRADRPGQSDRADQSDRAASQVTGIKMTVRNAFKGLSSEQTIYTGGDRKRLEYRNATGGARHADGSMDVQYGPHIASITRCDLGQMFELNLDAGEYHVAPYPPKPLTKEQMESRGIKPQASMPRVPTVLIELTTVDTGERKEIFGHPARHVIATRKETPLEGSQSEAQEWTTDGWYIDLDNRISCDRKWAEGKGAYSYATVRLGNANTPPEMPKFVAVGKPETGFVVESKVTSRGTYVLPDGTRKEYTSTHETTVTNLEEGPLDSAVFEVPAEFRQVARVETNSPVDWQTAWVSAWEQFKARAERLFD